MYQDPNTKSQVQPIRVGSKTEDCLLKAFAGESQARNKYTFFAKLAREAGLEHIAAIFEETADNEKEHAKMIFKLLGGMKDTADGLQKAIEGEYYEWTQMYPSFEKIAKKEGFRDAAVFFKEVAEVEEQHEKRYQKLLDALKNKTVFQQSKEVLWKCRNCGYVHRGKIAPDKCPNCLHHQGYFEIV